MSNSLSNKHEKSAVWVSPITPGKTLDVATWIETTRYLRKAGWNITLIAIGDPGIRQVKGVDVHFCRKPGVYLFGQLLFHLAVLRIILSRWSRTDVILFHQISAMWLAPLRLVRCFTRRRRPVLVMDTRDLVDAVPGNLRIRIRLWFFHNIVFKLAKLTVDGQTVITPRMSELVNVPPHRLLGMWPSGVDVSKFKVARDMRHWPAADETVRLVYVGILLKRRHLRELCDAVVRANGDGMRFKLSLVGSGADQDTLEEYASRHPEIVVHGPVVHSNIPTILGKADIGVTSLPFKDDLKYQASSPIKLFEYMAAGMPILSTRNPCHVDVIASGPYAFWAEDATTDDMYTALCVAWARRQDLASLGQQAYFASQNWTWEAAAKKLSNAMEAGLHRVEVGCTSGVASDFQVQDVEGN